jgi:hypothetical protein
VSAPNPTPCSGELPVMKVRDLMTNRELEPDWSCYEDGEVDLGAGANADFDGGTDVSTRSVSFRAATLLPALVAGVTVDFFAGGSTLGMPVATRAFDAESGIVAFDVPAGSTTISARVHALARDNPSYNIIEMREYDFPVPANDAPIDGNVMIRDSRNLAVSLALPFGRSEDPERAIILSAARDCRGRDVRGAQFELVDGESGELVPTGREPDVATSSYWQYALPTADCTFTGNEPDATWMLIDAPVNVHDGVKTHPYRLRVKGRMRASDVTPVVFAEREVELFAGVISLVRLDR